MSEDRDPPKPAAPREGDARPTTGRLRKLDSLDSARYAAAASEPSAGGGERAAAPRRSGEQGPLRTSAARRERRERAAARESAGRERNQRGDGRRSDGPRGNAPRADSPRSNDARGDSRHNPGTRGSGLRSAAGQRNDAPRAAGEGRSAGERRRAGGAHPGAARASAKPGPPGARAPGREPGADAYARSRNPHPAAPALPADDVHPGARVRAIAARTLDAVLHRGRSLKAELAAALPALADPRDRALVEAICFAVLRQPLRLEAALNEWMPRPLPPRDSELRALLLAGLAQLDPLGLPAHAALDASVEAARLLGRGHQAGLVNALLRRAQRDGLPAVDPRVSHWPSWLRGMLRKDWPQHYEAILAQSALAPPMWLRVNRARASREDYLQRLNDAGLAAAAPAGLADALRLDEPHAVAALPGFAEGAASVQDASAQRVADALTAAPGARVLDACAAPGGKSAHLLERDPSLRLTALDVDAARLQRVRATLARAGFDADGERVRLHAADAAELDAWWDGAAFDAVLLDAPCSATGIVRRQPDVVLHRRESDIAALSFVQARLLDALWRTLAPGGVLVYATCSILKAENEDQVRAFLARTADARVEALGPDFGHDREVGRQRLPGEDGGDGFFYARLRRAG